MIGFGEAISRFYRGYVQFEGRATRAEYWWPQLMQVLVLICMVIAFLSLVIAAESNAGDVASGSGAGAVSILIVYFIFALVNFLPNLAVSVRRFHDLDQSGWLVLVFILANAFIGVTVFAQMIWFAFRGTDGPNQYGPDPFGYDADLFG